MTTSINNDKLLTEQQAADLVGITRDTLRKYRDGLRGPAYIKIGVRVIRYRRADLISWIDGCRHDPRTLKEAQL